MAGLGLTDAVMRYQQGVQWRQQQDQLQKQQERQALIDGANKAATDVLERSKAEWALNGAQGEYRPNDMTMLEAAEARGMALAKGGDWEAFLQNEAAVQPHRIRVRSSALQAYEQDGDIEKLARTVYPTVFDGKKIVGIERQQGAPGSDGQGAIPAMEAIPDKLKVKLSDGSEQVVEPSKIVAMVKQSLVDPRVAAENEVKLNFLRAQEAVKGEAERANIRERGRVDQETAGVKAQMQRGLEGLKFNNQRTLQAERQAFEATEGAANRKSAEQRTATSAAATRYAADKGLDSAKERNNPKDKPPREIKDDEIIKAVRERYGATSMGAFGGTKTTDETVDAMALSVREILDANPGLDLTRAIAEAAKVHKVKAPKAGLGR